MSDAPEKLSAEDRARIDFIGQHDDDDDVPTPAAAAANVAALARAVIAHEDAIGRLESIALLDAADDQTDMRSALARFDEPTIIRGSDGGTVPAPVAPEGDGERPRFLNWRETFARRLRKFKADDDVVQAAHTIVEDGETIRRQRRELQALEARLAPQPPQERESGERAATAADVMAEREECFGACCQGSNPSCAAGCAVEEAARRSLPTSEAPEVQEPRELLCMKCGREDTVRSAVIALRSPAPTRSRTLDELCEEEGALGSAARKIEDAVKYDYRLGLGPNETRALADYLSRPASEPQGEPAKREDVLEILYECARAWERGSRRIGHNTSGILGAEFMNWPHWIGLLDDVYRCPQGDEGVERIEGEIQPIERYRDGTASLEFRAVVDEAWWDSLPMGAVPGALLFLRTPKEGES